MQAARYSETVQSEFSHTLNRRVAEYFKEREIDPNAGKSMILKSSLLFGCYVAVYLLMILGGITNLSFLFFFWILLGLGQSFIGMSIMHDTVHDSYTKNPLLRFLLQIPIIAIGVEPRIWRIEHNVLHHTYPNVEGVDQDIHPRYVFRFTENQPRKCHHGYQHIYATFIYGLLLIEWLTVKDFMKVITYYRMGFFNSSQAIYTSVIILVKKLLFYLVFLFIPLKILPFEPLVILAMLFTMLITGGISMTIVFQLAHVVPCCKTENNTAQLAFQSWHVHQLETTCDFAHDNKLVSYLIGGLNYQVEHHLFPHICHTHYPEIAAIVKQTAGEFDLPYHYENTFWGVVKAHYGHLRELGRME